MTDHATGPTTLNHVAYQTTDTGRTHDFYTRVLGGRLVSCVRSDVDPTGRGDDRPWIHTFFAFESGEIIAFFEVDGLAPPKPDPRTDWTRHIAFNVPSFDALKAWRRRLKECGITVSPVVDHEDGLWRSIYFQDPNGINLELTYMGRALGPEDEEQALAQVRKWTADRAQRVPSASPAATAAAG